MFTTGSSITRELGGLVFSYSRHSMLWTNVTDLTSQSWAVCLTILKSLCRKERQVLFKVKDTEIDLKAVNSPKQVRRKESDSLPVWLFKTSDHKSSDVVVTRDYSSQHLNGQVLIIS